MSGLVRPLSRPPIVGEAPAFYIDFTAGQVNTLPGASLVFTRSSTAWYFNPLGLLVSAAADVPRFTYDPLTLDKEGLLMELATTNEALWSRDMTNAAWTKSNITAAKTQTGLDGVANSASSLTATAGNGTCLQSITSSANTRRFDVYIKRLTGTGEIDITMDNGGSWTNVTSSLTTANFVRVSMTSASAANPTVGFRIVTSGDAIAVDCAQEVSQVTALGASTPIITTTVAVQRTAESATFTVMDPWLNRVQGTTFCEFKTNAAPSRCFEIANNASDQNSSITLRIGAAPNYVESVRVNNVAEYNSGSTAYPAGSVGRHALAWALNNTQAAAAGVMGVVDAVVPLPDQVANVVRLGNGGASNNIAQPNGTIRKVASYQQRLNDQQVQELSRL